MCEPAFSTSPKRIAVFTYSYAPLMTGISAIVHDRVEVLLRSGHQVHLIHPDTSKWVIESKGMYGLEQLRRLGSFSSSTFPTVPNPIRKSMPDPASFRKWSDTEHLTDFRPDVVLVDEAAGLFGAGSACVTGYKRPVGVAYGQKNGIPVVNLNHTDWRSYAEHYVGPTVVKACWPAVKFRMRALTDAYNCNLSPSKYLASRYVDFYRHPLEHLYFHGVNCADFSPENSSLPEPMAVNSPLIVSSGRVAREKNTFKLIEAFQELRRTVPSATLAILGDGPSLAKIRVAAKDFDGKLIVPGAVFGDSLKWWLAKADIYWTASTTENFSMGILEAMASGTPVVTYAAGGNTEQVEHGVSGRHCSPPDTADFARQTSDLLLNHEKLAAYSIAARQRATVFDNSICVQRLMNRIFQPFAIDMPHSEGAKSEQARIAVS